MSQTSGSTYPGKYGDWEKHAKLYEDGKHRRYELLFAVNGGAFAIGKLFVEHQQGADKFLKDLSLNQVAVGMIVFTIMQSVFSLAARRT
jgi:hypothetical protein